jgi:hypothetical protein
MPNMHANQQAVFVCGILFCLTNFVVFFLGGAIGQGAGGGCALKNIFLYCRRVVKTGAGGS